MSALTLRKLCMKIIATLIAGLVTVSAFATEPAKAPAAPSVVAPAASAPVVKKEKKVKKPAKSTAAKDTAAPVAPAPAGK